MGDPQSSPWLSILSHCLMVWGYPNDLGDLQRDSSTDPPNGRSGKFHGRGLAKGTTLINFSFSNTFQAAFCSACLKGPWVPGDRGIDYEQKVTNICGSQTLRPYPYNYWHIIAITTSLFFTKATCRSFSGFLQSQASFFGATVRRCEAVPERFLVLRNTISTAQAPIFTPLTSFNP